MSRIFGSNAPSRDDEDSRVRSERRGVGRATSLLSVGNGTAIDWHSFSHAFLPMRLRYWAITLDVQPSKSTYSLGEPVPFRVTMHNRLPFPVRLRTVNPIRWSWAIDGLTEASQVSIPNPPARQSVLEFDRGEQKRFYRCWDQSIRTTKHEWNPVEPGEYVLSVTIHVDDPQKHGLETSTDVEVTR